jgi:copper resistance protein D
MIEWIQALSETIEVTCLALLTGGALISMMADKYKPVVEFPHRLFPVAALLAGLFSFVPVLRLILFLEPDTGWSEAVRLSVFHMRTGQVWLGLLVMTVLLAVFMQVRDIRTSRCTAGWVMFGTWILILIKAWMGHAASVSAVWGWILQSVHLTAVCVWAGGLMAVGFFAVDTTRWLSFLRWFTPTAIGCVTAVILAGWGLMSITTPEYVDSWVLPYGEALLIKQWMTAGVLVTAGVNGGWIRRKLARGETVNPLPWVRAEAVLIVLVVAITGWMSQEAAPHIVAETVRDVGVSPLFAELFPGKWHPGLRPEWQGYFLGGFLVLLALVLLTMIPLLFRQRRSARGAVWLAVLATCSGFLGVLVWAYGG